MSLGARIRQLRQHFKYSQETFGELCGGVTKGTVSQWESDISNPPIERLKEFKRRGHDFSFDWLLDGSIPCAYEPSPEARVYAAMQDMSASDKYMVVKICNSIAEPADNGTDPPTTKNSG